MSETTISAPESDDLTLSIEHANPEDAEEIMTIKRDASLAAYPNEEHGITLDDVRKKFTNDEMMKGIENWRTGIAMETEDGNARTFVARLDGGVVGYVWSYISGQERRLGQLYVLPDAQGAGIGSELLNAALEWLGREHDISLDVVSYNDKAIHLYEKYGFQKIGEETPEQFDQEQGIKLLPEIEMLRRAVH
jgi:ribosomal protein S18 acetylase RimI-like enzyme